MKRKIASVIAILVLGMTSFGVAQHAVADEWPLVNGDYWEVTGIDLKDGGALKYSQWLATEWRKNLDYSKSKGWIKDYMIFANVHGRAGEPDLYLVRVFDYMPSGAEGEKRFKEYREWSSKTIEKMQAESGNRAEYREVMSSSLLQELNFRN